MALHAVLLKDRLDILGELVEPRDRLCGREVEDLRDAVEIAAPLDHARGELFGNFAARHVDRRASDVGVDLGTFPGAQAIEHLLDGPIARRHFLDGLELLASLVVELLGETPLGELDPLVGVPLRQPLDLELVKFLDRLRTGPPLPFKQKAFAAGTSMITPRMTEPEVNRSTRYVAGDVGAAVGGPWGAGASWPKAIEVANQSKPGEARPTMRGLIWVDMVAGR
jgi:hypothetical protein